jgi:5-methylcytosine-specific restriction protein A
MAHWPYNTTTWKRLRFIKLTASAICETCERAGRIVPAMLVDHIVAIKDGGPAFPSIDELASMCSACHNQKHGKAGVAKGCDAAGKPVDPRHEFFREPYTPLKDGNRPGRDRPTARAQTYFRR